MGETCSWPYLAGLCYGEVSTFSGGGGGGVLPTWLACVMVRCPPLVGGGGGGGEGKGGFSPLGWLVLW